ncbi:MAG: T9SS type A sorting domain-containing protein [Chitinophagales bacterium]
MKHFNSIAFLFAIIFCNAFSLQAENWELFPFNQETYFYFETKDSKTISPYYVDFEEESGAYIRQYPLRNMIETATGGCYDDLNLNYIEGQTAYKEVSYNPHILKKDAYFRYVFQVNSSTRVVHFYPQTNVGESWEMEGQVFTDRPYSRLKITCVSNQFSSIFSVMDSVKTFEIEAFNGENSIEAEIEKFSFKISKKYGLVEWFDFRAWALFDPITKITLAGFENENGEIIGETTPKVEDFFPYTEGDVLKWKEVAYIDGQYPNMYHTDTITSVLKTNENISYTYNRNSTIEFSDNTLYETKSNEELTLEFFPQHFIDLHYWDLGMTGASGIYSTLDLNLFEDKMGDASYLLHIADEGTLFGDCRVLYLPDLGGSHQFFSTTFGVELDSKDGGFSGTGYYYIQLQEAFIGEDYFTPIEENTLPSLQLKLSPNPTKDYFTIQTNTNSNTPIQLQVFNLQGQSIFQSQFDDRIEVSLLDFPKGIYFVQASDGESQWIEKVIKY